MQDAPVLSLKKHLVCALVCMMISPGAWAQATQSQGTQPLSVIDWLGAQERAVPNATATLPAPPDEPPVATSAVVPSVNVQPLGEGSPRIIGLVPDSVTGLPASLWAGSDIAKVTQLIAGMPDLNLPAAQSLLYTVLLAQAAPPGGRASDGDALTRARVEKLMERGAVDPALSLIEQAGVTTSPQHFDLWMQISLLVGTEDRACAVLNAAPHLTQDYGTRIFCAARDRRWEDAALTFGSAQALGLMPDDRLALFARFLDPEAFEGEDVLPRPSVFSPLDLRLFETIGERVPSGTLPRRFAVVDLRDVAGWKSQIEAAERLARAGALPENRLLGIYSERRAAASGGVWDRVSALQRLETALEAGSTDAVAKTLPGAWSAVQDAQLEVIFASLFAAPLSTFTLDGRSGVIARRVALLSMGYEQAARGASDPAFAEMIAQGTVSGPRPTPVLEAAIFEAFSDPMPRKDLLAMVKQDRLGEAILQTLDLLHEGAGGRTRSLTDALSTLRALGLEDTARRAALQIVLLDR